MTGAGENNRGLPVGWIETRMDELGLLFCGQSPSVSEVNHEGKGTPYVTGPDQLSGQTIRIDKWTESPRRTVPDGCIFITVKGAGVGTTFPGIACAIGRDVYAFKPHNVFGRSFVHYALNREISKVVGQSAGLIPGLSRDHIMDHEILLPPLAEQRRIVAKLDSILPRVEKVRERLGKIPALVKRFRQSVLTAAVTGKLTERWRAKNLGAGEWVETDLRSVVSKISYGSAAKSQKQGRIPVLRMGNIQDGKLKWDDLVYTSDASEIEKYLLESGDVLFNRTNSPDLVGKTAVYSGERKSIFAGYLISVKCSENLLPQILNFILNSPFGQDWRKSVKSDGVSQSNINGTKLGELVFQLPSLPEQQEIVRQVDKLFALADKLEAHYHKAMNRVEKFPQAILAKAFRGELVPQDPNDEPAEKLLERIRQERDGLEAGTKVIRKAPGKPRQSKAKAFA